MEAKCYVRVKPVLVDPRGVDPFGPEIVTRHEETLLRSEAAGVKIRALLFCKWEFKSTFTAQWLMTIL